MTALKKYQRLECPGLWRETPEAQRRDVIVSFGEASLILSDTRSESALTHWSLPAVSRLNPGEVPALYSPGAEQTETLELDDTSMIEAIETVRGAIAAQRPRPGRLRNTILSGTLALIVGLGVFWVPGALIEHTASVVPFSKRVEIGQMALADLGRVAGQPCGTILGLRALGRLSDRLFGKDAARLVVLRDGVAPAAHLPGRIIVLHRDLVERPDGPELAAGYALAERARALDQDPLVPLLRYAGLHATFRLLTTGNLPEASIAGYGERLVTSKPAPIKDATLLSLFAAAEVSSAIYAYAIDPTGETVLGLIEADPFRTIRPRPVLPDGDWVSLQAICSE